MHFYGLPIFAEIPGLGIGELRHLEVISSGYRACPLTVTITIPVLILQNSSALRRYIGRPYNK